MRRRWSHFDRRAREATGKDLRTLITEFSHRNGPITAQQVSSHITQLVGELYSPEAARYGCRKYGVALEVRSRGQNSRHRGRHQRIIADHVDPSKDFAWAIYHITRQHDRHDLTRLASRLSYQHGLSVEEFTCLTRCLMDAVAIERWLTVGGFFGGAARAQHNREIESQRAQAALSDEQVVGFEGQGPGLLCRFHDPQEWGGLVLRRDKDGTVYMRLETPESIEWYRTPQEPQELPHV